MKKSQKWWYMFTVASSFITTTGCSRVRSHRPAPGPGVARWRSSGAQDCSGDMCSRLALSRARSSSQPCSWSSPGPKMSILYLRFSVWTRSSSFVKSSAMLVAEQNSRLSEQRRSEAGLVNLSTNKTF